MLNTKQLVNLQNEIKTIMKKRLLKILCVNFITTLFFLISSSCYSQISIDFNKIVLNDSIKLGDLDAETVTDILGRPTIVENNEATVDIIGNKIIYHNLGLSFTFYPKKKDPKQKLYVIDLYLVKTWDKKHNEFFMPFLGKLIPELNANLKINEILPLFENDSAYIFTAKESYEMKRNALKSKGYKSLLNSLEPDKYDNVVVKKENCTFYVRCEEITKFLENIYFQFNLNN